MSVFENTTMIAQKKTPMRWAVEIAVLFAAICMTISMILWILSPIIFFVPTILAYIAFYFIHKYNYIEYEYTWIEGQLDIDRIYAKSRRKSVAKIDMEDLIIIAPEGSREVSNYERDSSVTVKDCSTRLPENKKYAAIYKDEKGTYRIIFEPDENILDLIIVRNPRKVVK